MASYIYSSFVVLVNWFHLWADWNRFPHETICRATSPGQFCWKEVHLTVTSLYIWDGGKLPGDVWQGWFWWLKMLLLWFYILCSKNGFIEIVVIIRAGCFTNKILTSFSCCTGVLILSLELLEPQTTELCHWNAQGAESLHWQKGKYELKLGHMCVHPVGQPDWADIVELGNSLLPVTWCWYERRSSYKDGLRYFISLVQLWKMLTLWSPQFR